MAGKNPHIKLSGMNNKSRPEDIPSGKASNAVNVQFANGTQGRYSFTPGEIIFTRPGKTRVYTGTDIHSLHVGNEILFAEDGGLKLLNANLTTATTLQSGIGNSRVFYARVADTTYLANEIFSGKVRNGVLSEWGTARPTRQPDCAAGTYGGMYAGDYRVAITWKGTNGEEGGTGMGRRVTVAEGGGINLSNFPVPPSYVTAVSVYISSVNGDTMWWYGDYPANTSALTLTRKICTIPLQTQFMYPPKPRGIIVAHQGVIYYADGNRLYRTLPQRYGLTKARTSMLFDSEIRAVLTTPPTLWVNTTTQMWRVDNLGSPDGSPPRKVPEHIGNAVKGSECYDRDGLTAYFVVDGGFAEVTAQDFKLLSYGDVAMDFFDEGSCVVTEVNGLKYLTFCGSVRAANPLANAEWSAAELIREAN
jgi:hypothetical protein